MQRSYKVADAYIWSEIARYDSQTDYRELLGSIPPLIVPDTDRPERLADYGLVVIALCFLTAICGMVKWLVEAIW